MYSRSIGTTFNNNQVIEYFMEFQYFTKLTSLYVSSSSNAPFYNCKKLKWIKVPEGVTNCRNAFYNCSTITFIELPSTITTALDNYTFRGTSGNKRLIVHFKNPVNMSNAINTKTIIIISIPPYLPPHLKCYHKRLDLSSII